MGIFLKNPDVDEIRCISNKFASEGLCPEQRQSEEENCTIKDLSVKNPEHFTIQAENLPISDGTTGKKQRLQ